MDPGSAQAGPPWAVTHLQTVCSAFVELMADLQAFSMTHTPAQLLDFALQRSDYAVQVKVSPKCSLLFSNAVQGMGVEAYECSNAKGCCACSVALQLEASCWFAVWTGT